MAFMCKCGCDTFIISFKEIIFGDALVDSEAQIYDTFQEETQEFNYEGPYKCYDCGLEYDDIFENEKEEKDPEIKWLDEKKAHYIETGGVNCPICDESHSIEGGSVEISEGGAWQYCSCSECDAEWYDQYTLTSISMESYQTDHMLKDVFPKSKEADPNKAFKEK